MKRITCCLLVLLALLAGCVAPPVLPPVAPTAAASAAPATAAASPTPEAPVAPGTAEAVAQETVEPVPATPEPPAPTADTRAPTATALLTVTPDRNAQPVAVATVAQPTTNPATPVALASPALSGLGSTEVISPATHGSTTYNVSEISLPTYPYAAFLKQTVDPAVDYPALSLDRAAYEASNPRSAPKTYKLLTLENRYLRVSILPELGGRIYECVFKPTGANEFYSNPVVKPTTWGPGAPPNAPGANWWPAAGGLEWGFPVEEHGYEFGTTWGYDHATLPDGTVMITVYTQTGPEKPYAVVDVVLPPDTAYFVVQPRVTNPLGAAFRFKFWLNAMLAPGRANTVSPELRFVVPGNEMTVHSAGDAALAAGEAFGWPLANGRDLSRLGNWRSHLGAFSRPAASGNFAAVYDPSVDEGMVRVFPAQVARGLKLFAPVGLDPALWTDDGSAYVELHGGLSPTFSEWHELGPGEAITWSEFWYPVAGIGGLTFANERAALSVQANGGNLRVGLFPTAAISGQLTVTTPGGAPVSVPATVSPERPFLADLLLPAAAPAQGDVAVKFVDEAGATVLEWAGPVQLR